MLIEAQGTQAAEQDVIAQRATGKRTNGCRVEEVAGQRFKPQGLTWSVRFEEAKVGKHRQPEVVMAFVGEMAFFRKAAQAIQAVVAPVDLALAGGGRGREDEITLFDHQQEKQPVDEAQQVLVVGFGRQTAFADRLTQFIIGRMGEKTVGEVANGLFHCLGEAFADARAGIEGILVIALDQAFRRGFRIGRQASDVQQAVEHREVGKQAVAEDAVEVEFQVAQFDEPGTVAQQAQDAAVGDQAVQLVVQVEVFLHQCVRGHARGAECWPKWRALRLAVQPGGFAVADDVDRSAAAMGGAVGDGVGLAVEFDALGLEFDLVAEEAKQGDDPEVAGFGGSRSLWSQGVELALKDAPVILGVGPGTGNFILDLAAAVQAEIGRTLAVSVFEAAKDVRRENGAFNADAGVGHAR